MAEGATLGRFMLVENISIDAQGSKFPLANGARDDVGAATLVDVAGAKVEDIVPGEIVSVDGVGVVLGTRSSLRLVDGRWPRSAGIEGAVPSKEETFDGGGVASMRLRDFLCRNPLEGGNFGVAVTIGEEIISPQSSSKLFGKFCVLEIDEKAGMEIFAAG
jgi:hypothetical protein